MERVGEVGSATATPASTSAHVTFQTFLAIPVIYVFLLLIAQNLISLGDVFELLFSSRRLVFVRVMFERHLSVGLSDFLVGGISRDA